VTKRVYVNLDDKKFYILEQKHRELIVVAGYKIDFCVDFTHDEHCQGGKVIKTVGQIFKQ
jgi:nicotinamidase-related amidase